MRVIELLFHGFGGTMFDVFIALAPIVAIFFLLQLLGMRISRRDLGKILTGFLFTYVGLVLFMQGVEVAFSPVGEHLGAALAALPYNWILIPIGFVMGFLVAFAEPAVHVMIKQVEELSAGAIKAGVMLAAISLGVASAVALAMFRLLSGINLWWFVLPGYAIVFVLARFTDKTFMAMAFDNGGVATGPMCSTFILAMGLSIAKVVDGRDAMLDGFGIVSLIALAPIITTMLLSFVYKKKAERGGANASLPQGGQAELEESGRM